VLIVPTAVIVLWSPIDTLSLNAVGVAIAYDTFFAAENVSEIYKNSKPSLGPVSEFVRDLSKNVPFLYGMASLVLALGLGVGAAVLRKVLSKLKDKLLTRKHLLNYLILEIKKDIGISKAFTEFFTKALLLKTS